MTSWSTVDCVCKTVDPVGYTLYPRWVVYWFSFADLWTSTNPQKFLAGSWNSYYCLTDWGFQLSVNGPVSVHMYQKVENHMLPSRFL